MSTSIVANTLQLPCGAVLKNRFAKSAMSENMASSSHAANSMFNKLYENWSSGGCGLLISGNVMIDSTALGEPNNVVVEKGTTNLDALKHWAKAGTQNGTHLWMQLNHPGKQSPKFLSKQPVAPSAIPFSAPLSNMFNCPRELSESEILDIISRFSFGAKTAQEAGFTGVQIHGAHGYLVSQFLSPRHNARTDRWGGSLENRMRFLVMIYQGIRSAVGPNFPVSLKLNSADFQKGGFTEEESIEVVTKMSSLGVDLIEISGGSYESPQMMTNTKSQKKETTSKREAYFLDYCERVRKVVKTPLMLTGGFRSLAGMEHALEVKACDMIGLARSVALSPHFPNHLLQGKDEKSYVTPLTTGIKAVDKLFPLEILWYTQQIHRMGKGRAPNPQASALGAVFKSVLGMGAQSLRRVRAKG